MSDHVEQANKALSAAQMMLRSATHDSEQVSAAALVGIGHALLAVAEEISGSPGESPASNGSPVGTATIAA